MAKSQISIPLDIEDVNVLKVEVNQNGDFHITVECSLNYGYCRKCGQKLTTLHSYDAWVKVQHLPILGHAVFLGSTVRLSRTWWPGSRGGVGWGDENKLTYQLTTNPGKLGLRERTLHVVRPTRAE